MIIPYLIMLGAVIFGAPTGQAYLLTKATGAGVDLVKALDNWLSTKDLEEARRRVAEIEQHDRKLTREVYRMHRERMSPQVRREFERVMGST